MESGDGGADDLTTNHASGQEDKVSPGNNNQQLQDNSEVNVPSGITPGPPDVAGVPVVSKDRDGDSQEERKDNDDTLCGAEAVRTRGGEDDPGIWAEAVQVRGGEDDPGVQPVDDIDCETSIVSAAVSSNSNCGVCADTMQVMTISQACKASKDGSKLAESLLKEAKDFRVLDGQLVENMMAREIADRISVDEDALALAKSLTAAFNTVPETLRDSGDKNDGDNEVTLEMIDADDTVDEKMEKEHLPSLNNVEGAERGPAIFHEYSAADLCIDNFFGTRQCEQKTKAEIQFPALENVDFESDEDGHELEEVLTAAAIAATSSTAFEETQDDKHNEREHSEKEGSEGVGSLCPGDQENETVQLDSVSEADVNMGQTEGLPDAEDTLPDKMLKRKKRKKERFYELIADVVLDSTEDTVTQSESDSTRLVAAVENNSNNNNRVSDENYGTEAHHHDGLCDVNNSANDRLGQEYSRDSHYSAGDSRDRQQHSRSSHPSSDHRYRSSSGGRDYDRHQDWTNSRSFAFNALSFAHSDSPSRIAARSRENSSYFRSGDPSSVDSSWLSSRNTHMERPDPRVTSTRPESTTVPKFKTLQDQQVSWLEMFKLIEAQHRTELQSQYKEHEQLLQDMQCNMQKELCKQQDTLKQRLSTHREFLEDLSPGRHRATLANDNCNQSMMFEEGESISADSKRSWVDVRGSEVTSSQTTLAGVPVALKKPAPFSGGPHQDFSTSRDSSDQLRSKRSQEHNFSSPSCPADTSLNLSRLSVGGEKQLRGGVYSSPMPLAKAKHRNSPRGSKSQEETTTKSPREERTRTLNMNSAHLTYEHRQSSSADVSLTESEDVLSPRSRISLREKHAKHLSDLRAYYEEELREMRQHLSSKQSREVTGSSAGGTSRSIIAVGDRILANENQELRQRFKQLQDDHHDAKIQIRELQQKLQGLEIRSSDYAERYDTAQAQVLSLRTRLEELTGFAKDKEIASSELEAKNKRSWDSLQMAYKKEKELTESIHSAETTIGRLVDRYETLEKDHQLLKENLSTTEEKLFVSRSEAMKSNNVISRLELENKQFHHDNGILKHDLTMAKNAVGMKTSYNDSYHVSNNSRGSRTPVQNIKSHPTERQHRSLSRDRYETLSDQSPESETESGSFVRSPILKAEREMKRFQQSMGEQEFSPKLQRKFYGTEVKTGHRDDILSRHWTNNNNKSRSTSSQVLKTGSSQRDDKKSYGSPQQSKDSSGRMSTAPRTPNKADSGRLSRAESGRLNKADNGRLSKEKNGDVALPKSRDFNMPSRSIMNGMSSDAAMEKIKSGDIVSRPAWEDVYTSLALPNSGSAGNKIATMNSTREQMIQERIQNIESIERKYDDLAREKRKYESALSKIPCQGHHRREKERLETELDRVDRELGSIRMSLKRFHVLKSTI